MSMEKSSQFAFLKFRLGGAYEAILCMFISILSSTGRWSLPASWSCTVLDAHLAMSSVAKPRSGVVVVLHLLE